DAAGGEQVVVRRAQRVDRLDDALLVVGHHAHLGKADALDLEPACDLGDVAVVRAAREDLVADHDERGGPDALAHAASPTWATRRSNLRTPSSTGRRRKSRQSAR